MDFRHPSAIRQELSRYLNLRHKVEDALKDPALPSDQAVVAEQTKIFALGVIAALEWALCTRTQIDPQEERDDQSSVP